MSYMKEIYTLICTEYPEKKDIIIADFEAWIHGKYDKPRTPELQEILQRRI